MKSYSNRKLWYRNSAEIDLSIHEKLLQTHSGKPQLKHLDGASMKNYQVPHKAFETLQLIENTINIVPLAMTVWVNLSNSEIDLHIEFWQKHL